MQQSTFPIRERCLTPEEAARLSAAIRDTPNILGYRPEELQKFSGCLVGEAPDGDGTLAGVCITKKMAGGWSEIAILYVFPEHRRHGLGGALFGTMLRRLRDDGQKVLCTSREPSVLRLMEKAGMRYVPEWRLPPPVHLARTRHYLSAYRFREAVRKSGAFRDQPPFRHAVTG